MVLVNQVLPLTSLTPLYGEVSGRRLGSITAFSISPKPAAFPSSSQSSILALTTNQHDVRFRVGSKHVGPPTPVSDLVLGQGET